MNAGEKRRKKCCGCIKFPLVITYTDNGLGDDVCALHF